MTLNRLFLSAALIMVLPLAAEARDPGAKIVNGGTVALKPSLNISAKFAPQAQTKRTRLDYTVLDEALGASVLRFGPSLRRRMSKPRPQTGSRFVSGHKSAYRLEGSRVGFSFLSEEYLDELSAYRADLERIGSELDLTRLSRNEQLAFWLNLHNVAMIEQISKQYPKTRPSRIKIDGVLIDDAKVLTIKGVPLSLRDIREKVVFPNWSGNPNVIYGFFRGDIGSPALQNYAYTSDNVNELLVIQATEFVNSLRGFNRSSKHRNVSRLYDEAKMWYFPNWEQDLSAHLLKYAREDVAADIRVPLPMALDRYDDVVADLMGGDRPRIATASVQDAMGSASSRIPMEVYGLLKELNDKTTALRRRKLINSGGTVTIEDIETIDVDIPDE